MEVGIEQGASSQPEDSEGSAVRGVGKLPG